MGVEGHNYEVRAGSGLNVVVGPGAFWDGDTKREVTASQIVPVTASATRYIYLNWSTGVAAAYSAVRTEPTLVPIAIVQADAASITSIEQIQ